MPPTNAPGVHVPAIYDSIGIGYANRRRSDPRIAAVIHAELNGYESVVNVGAGTGSYEPSGINLVAVEPSSVMLRQRPADSAPAVCASAAALPFPDSSFDASLAILTLHHWPNLDRGLGELQRVARHKVIVLTFDPDFEGFWLVDYLPELVDIDRETMPPIEELRRLLGRLDVIPVPIPYDCIDGFLGAYWRRPEVYLNPDARAAISSFSKFDATAGLEALERDLSTGTWHERYGHLLACSEIDLGYRLITA